jgi:hypothetical protein
MDRRDRFTWKSKIPAIGGCEAHGSNNRFIILIAVWRVGHKTGNNRVYHVLCSLSLHHGRTFRSNKKSLGECPCHVRLGDEREGKSVIPRVFPPKAVRKIYRVISHNLRPIANMNPGFSKSEQVTTCSMLDVKSHSRTSKHA